MMAACAHAIAAMMRTSRGKYRFALVVMSVKIYREKYCKGRTMFVHLVAVCVAMQLAMDMLVLLPVEKPFVMRQSNPGLR